MHNKKWFFLICFSLSHIAYSQTVLQADGPDDTYELINSVLAPGYDAVEEPDCGHSSFGRHIDEVFDSVLNGYVFRFHIHTFPDNDRCQNFDRQRNEIKTYDQSPDSLLGTENETVQYNWKFKLDSTFQPSSSFTHLHQIKAVGGPEESMPLITLTARKGTPDKLELRYAESLSQTTIQQTSLDALRGIWLAVTETITYGEIEVGEYDLVISNLSNGDTLFQYENNSIRMWKTNTSFLRPKWGIYRSLNDSINLKDEIVLFADITIEEMDGPILSIDDESIEPLDFPIYPNPADDFMLFSDEVMRTYDAFSMYNLYGQLILSDKIKSKKIYIRQLNPGVYFVHFSKKGNMHQAVKIVVE